MSALKPLFSDIAAAIREKDGTDAPIQAEAFPERIRAIPTGGGTGGPYLLSITFDKMLIGKPYSVTNGERTLHGIVPRCRNVQFELSGPGMEYHIQAGDIESRGEAVVETKEGTTEYSVTVEGKSSICDDYGRSDVEHIHVCNGSTIIMSVAELARSRDGTLLNIPCYGVEAQQALSKILGVCDTKEPSGLRRSDVESDIMSCMAERQVDGPPNVFLFRGYVSPEQVELGTADIGIKAFSSNSQLQVMGNNATTASRGAVAADKEAGAGNMTKATYGRGTRSSMNLTVTLDRLKDATANVQECRYGYDEWLSSWPVEFVYFKVITNDVVHYYILELRVQGAGESGRQRAIAYVDDGGQEGYAMWVCGSRVYTGNNSYKKKQYMAVVDYKKDANGQDVYATDTNGGYLETTLLEDGSYAYVDAANSRNIRITKENGIYRYVDTATGNALSNPGAVLLLDERGAPVRIPADIVVDDTTEKGYHTGEDGAALLDMGGRYIPKRYRAKVNSLDQDGGIGSYLCHELECPGDAVDYNLSSFSWIKALAPREARQIPIAVRTKRDVERDMAGEDMVYGALEYEVNIEREDNGDIAEDYPLFSYLFGSPTGTSSDIWTFFPKEADGVFRIAVFDTTGTYPVTIRASIGSGYTVRFFIEDDPTPHSGGSDNQLRVSAAPGTGMRVKAIASNGTEEQEYRIEMLNVDDVAEAEKPAETVLPRI